MIVTLQTARTRTIEQVAAFVEANAQVEFQPLDRDGAYAFGARQTRAVCQKRSVE